MSWAEKYLALPFVDGGRDVRGVDCWGLIRLVYLRELQIELPSYGEIGALELARIAREMKRGAAGMAWRRVEEPMAFDIAAMSGNPVKAVAPRSIVHVGVMVDHARIMHVEPGSGVSVPALSHPAVSHRILGFYRYASR